MSVSNVPDPEPRTTIDLTGRFDDLPILGDALEEAGCTDPKVLQHARQPRHYRGCWLLDAVLGKA